jgi:tetratricopeptide (TPR) repeat protein
MPKQRHKKPARPAPKRSAAKTRAKVRKPVRAHKPAKASTRSRPAGKTPARVAKTSAARRSAPAAPKKPSTGPAGPSNRDRAVDVYEHGFQALQQREFGRAATLFARVVSDYPDEKELHERAKVYLTICERQKGSPAPTPRSLEERINAATVAINRGAYAEGLALLRKVETDHRDNDHLHYLLCVAHAVLGEATLALDHLKRAVALNPENRYLASQDADLESLRADAGFTAALDTPQIQAPGHAPVKASASMKAAAPGKAGTRRR